jgi:hypothetical protein
MSTLVENNGLIQLFQNNDGTYAASENGSLKPIYDMGSTTPFNGGGTLAAADYYNGYRVVVFNGGHIWYVNSNWQKASVGPNGRDTDNISPSEVTSLFLSGAGGSTTPAQPVAPPVTYTITGPANVDEGAIAMFPLQTTGLPAGTTLTYNITGIDPSRINGGQLTGTLSINASGSVPIPLPLAANNRTDGPTSVTIRLTNGQASFTAQINDTSTGSTANTGAGTLVEGLGAVKLFQNTDGTYYVNDNSVLSNIYNMGSMTPFNGAGSLAAADYYNGYRVVVFNGGHVWYVNSNWQKAPVGPGGRDTDNLSMADVNNIFLSGSGGGSNPTPPVQGPVTYTITGPASVDEGAIAMFPLQTTGLPAGTTLTYTITGIDPSRINGGQLTGTVGINASGSVPIPLPLAANNKTDGPTTVTIRLTNGQASFSAQINDTSTGPTTGTGTLVESYGSVKLYQNTDGYMSVVENGQRFDIRNTDGTTKANGFVAADIINGVRQAVYSSGAIWYLDSTWKKAPTGPQGRDTDQITPAEVATQFLTNTPVTKLNTPPVANQINSFTLDPLVTTATPLNLAAPSDANGDALSIRIDSLPSTVRIASNGNSLYVGQSFTVAEFTGLTATFNSTGVTATALGQLAFTISDGKGGSTSSSVAFTLKSTAPTAGKLTGNDSNNQLQGTTGNDVISAGGGNDTILASAGNDVVNGGTGLDALVFSSVSTGVSFAPLSDGSVSLTYNGSTQTLTDVERVHFSGKSYALDLNGNAGNAAKLITAAFGVSMVKEYLGVGLTLTDGGMNQSQLNDFVIELGLLPTASKDFVNVVFNNIVGRLPNTFESSIYTGMLDSGAVTRSTLLGLAESTSLVNDAITKISVVGVALEYTPSAFG